MIITLIVLLNVTAFFLLFNAFKQEANHVLIERENVRLERENLKIEKENSRKERERVAELQLKNFQLGEEVNELNKKLQVALLPKPEPPKKNRIAVLISGAIRSFPDLFYFLYRNFLEANGFPDIFFNLVYITEEEKKAFERVLPHIPNVRKVHYEKFNLTQLIETVQLEGGYSNFPFTTEACSELLGKEKGCINWLSSLHLIYKANELRKEYEREVRLKTNLQENVPLYDLVVRMRSDLLFEQVFDLTNFPIVENVFYKPDLYNWYDGYNDQFGFGSPLVMDAYAQVYFLVEKVRMQFNVKYHPENYLRLVLSHIYKVQPQNVPVSYRIVRKMEFAVHTLDFRIPHPTKLSQAMCK
ncbi:hypothetical protein ABK040_008336 [Willaertia magna]